MKALQDLKIKSIESINYCHLGNGLCFYSTEKEVHGDYIYIAHADVKRNIKYYYNLDEISKAYIIGVVSAYNCTGSVTGVTPVFENKPNIKAWNPKLIVEISLDDNVNIPLDFIIDTVRFSKSISGFYKMCHIHNIGGDTNISIHKAEYLYNNTKYKSAIVFCSNDADIMGSTLTNLKYLEKK